MSQIEQNITPGVDENGNEIDYHSTERVQPYQLDDYYVEFITTTNWSKSECYRSACINSGAPVPDDYVPQYANKLHNRLATRIQAELDATRLGDTLKGRHRGLHLLEHARSEAVQAQMVKLMTEQHYKPEQVKQSIAVEVSRDCVKISTHGQTLTIDNDTYIESESESVETDTDDDDPFLVGTYPVNSHREQ